MITVFHGEDIAKSRDAFWQEKQKRMDALSFDGVKITITDVQQVISGDDLFGTTKPLFIEELFSKRKSQKEIDEVARLLSTSSADIFLWESKELTSRQIGLLKGAKVQLFKIPATIFALLDGLKPGNGKTIVGLYHQTLQDKDAEFVLIMLQRQVRMLLALQNFNEKSISEVSRLAPWQKGKLEKQAKLFTAEQLIALHSGLFQLEKDMKTGELALSLDDSLDLLFLRL